MNTITITSSSLPTLLEQIQKQIGGDLENQTKEYTLNLNDEIAHGTITGVSVEEAISFVEYNITFKEDTTVIHKLNGNQPIEFSYCSEGKLTQSFGEFGPKSELEQFQTGIFSNNSNQDTRLTFKKDEATKLSMIFVDVEAVTNEELKYQLQNTFIPNSDSGTYGYVGSFNVKIAERIQQLESIAQKGLVRTLVINGLVHLILALEIQQHSEDMVNANNKVGSLTKVELEDIKEISEFIQNYPEIQYSLKYLSRKSGLSPFKLQEGFKALYGRTVSDYIRNVRVEAGEKLIRTSDLNISEIVYTIGLTSRSYFSKIFKEKYNCSPKHYQSHQNMVAITA